MISHIHRIAPSVLLAVGSSMRLLNFFDYGTLKRMHLLPSVAHPVIDILLHPPGTSLDRWWRLR